MPSFTLSSPHGLTSIISTEPSSPTTPTILLLHDTSASSKPFTPLLDSPTLTQHYRLITFCLPGHGSSSNAPDPQNTYRPRGYADLAVHVLQHLRVTEVVVLGWGLGGMVGVEMVGLLSRGGKGIGEDGEGKKNEGGEGGEIDIKIRGLMLLGSALALGREQINQAFRFEGSDGDGLGVTGLGGWTDEQVAEWARYCMAGGKEEAVEGFMLEDGRRADGRARMVLAGCLLGTEGLEQPQPQGQGQGPMGVDQRRVVEETDTLVAVVNGSLDPYVNLEYLDEIKWRRLWRGKCVKLDGLGHAPFWEDSGRFEGILEEFLKDCWGKE
ncbi:alpha/beta hydrolase [Pyrenophora tritici-repentis]|nr:alpha/beta hydrolase [Pyrenophora tritici-repentis]